MDCDGHNVAAAAASRLGHLIFAVGTRSVIRSSIFLALTAAVALRAADVPVKVAQEAVSKSASSGMRVTDANRKHWSFLPLHPAEPPNVQDQAWARTPVDRFIRQAQEA